MTKKKIFGTAGLIMQLAAIGFSFAPYIYKVVKYELDPYAGAFVQTGDSLGFSIFFSPGKYLGNMYADSYCDPGLASAFSILFLLAGFIAAISLFTALIKKKRGIPALVFGISAAVCLLISFFCAVTFRYDYLTWQYLGKLAFGAPVLLLAQIAAVVMCALAAGKRK